MRVTPTVEADTLKRITDLQASITDEGSAEYVTRRRHEMEGDIRAADADVSHIVFVCVLTCADSTQGLQRGRLLLLPQLPAFGRMGCACFWGGDGQCGYVSRAFRKRSL